MATLTGQSIASSYEQLLHVDRDGGGNGTTLVDVKDGDNGTTFALKLATDKISVVGDDNVSIIIDSTTATRNGILSFTNSADSKNFEFKHNSFDPGAGTNQLEINSTDTADIMVFNLDGKIGFGTNAPTTPIHIKQDNSTTDTTNGLLIENDGTGDAVAQFLLTGTKRWMMGIDNSDSDTFKIVQGVSDLGTADGLVMALDTSGNVGIGKSSAGQKLEIKGDHSGDGINTFYHNNTNPAWEIVAYGTDGGYIFGKNNSATVNVQIRTDGDSFLKGGKLGIGADATHAKMEIVGDSDAFQLTMSDVADSDDTTKEARIGMLHYKQAEEPVTLMYAQSGSSTNTIVIGGGTGVGNHATSVSIATASTYNSLSTTTNMVIDNNSRVSLSNNDGGANNTTIFGYLAGNNSGSGATQNCYIGHESGKANVYGDDNVLIGFQSGLALGASSGSIQNSLVGSLSGSAITGGDYNTFLGYRTGSTGTNDITTGTFNTFIGKGVAGSSASATNQTAIGADVTAQADNSVTLGNADVTAVYMASDSGATVHCSGVNFPDTQSASADANTLDDYEEGFHTAVITPSVSGSVTQDSNYNQLAYTKVGRLVTVTGRLYLSAISSPNGHINITMPFTVADLNQLSESGAASVTVLNVTGANVGDFVALFIVGSALLQVYIGDGTTVQSDSANALTATSNIFISAQYFTS